MRNELTCKIFKYLGLGLLTTFLGVLCKIRDI